MAQPLTPAVFHVLLALAAGERHGYGIMKDVAGQSGGAVKIGPGTLYGTLQRLIECDWVAEAPKAGPRTVSGRERRYYRITSKGRAALDGDVARLEHLVRVVRAVRMLPRGSRT